MSGGDGGDGERRTGEVRWEESREIHAASSFLILSSFCARRHLIKSDHNSFRYVTM